MIGNVEKCVSLGWCMLPVFDHHGNQLSGATKTLMTGGGMRGDSVRLALYEGSPRMLLSIAHLIAGECECTCISFTVAQWLLYFY